MARSCTQVNYGRSQHAVLDLLLHGRPGHGRRLGASANVLLPRPGWLLHSSPGKHATAHHDKTRHPMTRLYEPREDWYLCFPGGLTLRAVGCPARLLAQLSLTPEDRHVIRAQPSVGGHQRALLSPGLRDQKPVERVTVVPRQHLDLAGMLSCHRQVDEVEAQQLPRPGRVEVQPA